MRILVLGAGVLGSLYAFKLKQSGEEVTILARGKRKQQIVKSGIVVIDAFSGKQQRLSIPVVEKLRPLDDYDLVALHVRANQLSSVLPTLISNKKIKTILFMLNYPAGFGKIYKSIDRNRVIAGFPGAGGRIDNQGIIHASIAPGFAQPTTLGELDGTITKRIVDISHIYQKAGFPVSISENIDAWLKTHITWTLPFQCTLYQFNYDIKTLANSQKALLALVEGIQEGIRVLKTLEIPILPWQIRFIFDQTPKFVPLFIVRWWFSSKNAEVYSVAHAKSAPDEAKFLAQEFKKLIIKSKISTPILNKLYTYIP